MKQAVESKKLRIGRWRIEADRLRLTRAWKHVHLEPRAMNVLVHLVEANGRIVHKDELKNEIWGSIYVVDEAVQRCISQIRSLLGDDYKQPRYIETVQKRGYRVIGASEGASTLKASFAAIVLAMVFVILPAGDQPSVNAGVMQTQANQVQRYQNAVHFYENLRQLDNESAMVIFRQLIAEAPDYAAAHSGLAEALAQKRLRWSADDDLLIEAAESAQLAIDLAPDAAHGYKAMGLVHQASWQYADALEMYELAIDRHAGLSSAIKNAAIIYTDLGFYDMALTMLDKAPKTTDQVALSGMRGLVNLRLGQWPESIKWFRQVLDMSPLSTGAVNGIAKAYLLNGQLEQSLQACAVLLEMNPRHSECLMTSGMAALLDGNNVEAAGYYRRLLQSGWAPGVLEARTRLAYIDYLEHGDSALLEDLRNRLLAGIAHIDQTDFPRAHNLAVLSAILGHNDEAMVWMTRAATKGRLYHEWAQVDPAYSALHGEVEFFDFLDAQRRRIVDRAACTRQTCMSGVKVAAVAISR